MFGIDLVSLYTPVVDPGLMDPVKYETDLRVCRDLALQKYNEYQDRQAANMFSDLLAGALTDAVACQTIDGNTDWTVAGAGAADGVAAGAQIECRPRRRNQAYYRPVYA